MTGAVGLASLAQWLRDERASSADDLCIDALQGQPFASFSHDMAARLAYGFVGHEAAVRHAIRAVRRPERVVVVDERANRHLLGKQRHAAGVIRMEVRDEEVVELRETGLLDRSDDAAGIASAGDGVDAPAAPVVRAVAGIDEQRLAGRGDDEGRLAAFDVDEPERQILRGHALSDTRPRARTISLRRFTASGLFLR